jgi:hypothetical protein
MKFSLELRVEEVGLVGARVVQAWSDRGPITVLSWTCNDSVSLPQRPCVDTGQ